MNEVFFVGDGPTWRLILFVLSCCNFLPAAVAEGWQIDLNFVFVTLPHALSSFRVTLLQLISYSHLCKICPYEFAVHKRGLRRVVVRWFWGTVFGKDHFGKVGGARKLCFEIQRHDYRAVSQLQLRNQGENGEEWSTDFIAAHHFATRCHCDVQA